MIKNLNSIFFRKEKELLSEKRLSEKDNTRPRLAIMINLRKKFSAATFRSLISIKTVAAKVPSRTKPISSGNRNRTILIDRTKVCTEGNFINDGLSKDIKKQKFIVSLKFS